MRVYLPSTLPRLARALAAGEIGPAPLSGYAVTPELREWYAEGDTEELEYAAMTAAARASLRLLAADRAENADVPPRRVVLAVEVPERAVQRDASAGERALVQVNAPVLVRDVAAGHVDDEKAAEDVLAAVEALPAADAGDEDARFVVDGAEGHELLWYATQELADL